MKTIKTRRCYLNNYKDVSDSCHNSLQSPNNENYDYSSDENINITFARILCWLFSIFSFIFDFGSDIYLIITYYYQKNFMWCILSLIFVFIPSLIITIFSLIWYWMDKTIILTFGRTGFIFRCFLHLFQLGPLVRFTDILIFAWRSKRTTDVKEKYNYYKLMLFEEADSALLRVMECCMESSPQLLLQLYIMLTQPKVKDSKVIILQCVSSITSLISLGWSLMSYQSCLRLTTPGKIEMNISSMIVMIFWKCFLIISRFISIALFTSVFSLYILAVLGPYYIAMAVFVIFQKTQFYSSEVFSFQEIMFNLIMATIFCVDFMNLKEGFTRSKYIFYYSISFCEIMILIILWYFNPPPTIKVSEKQFFNITFPLYLNSSLNPTEYFYYQTWPDCVRKIVLMCILISFLISIILMIIYYMSFHPTKNIKIWIYKRKKTDKETSKAGDVLLVDNAKNITSINV